MKRSRRILFKLLVVLVTYILFELVCYVFISTGYIPARKPQFNFVMNNKVNAVFTPGNDSWGAWHKPGHLIYQDGCVAFDYRINSAGARDRERSLTTRSKSRAVVVGDSFIEGWGVSEDSRVSNLLESQTGNEFMNFGCATLGLTQEFLVYKKLASGYRHDVLLIGFLPCNDFGDDDPEVVKTIDFYRPYFVRTDSNFKLVYKGTPPSLQGNITPTPAGSSFKEKTVRFLRSYTCWYNIWYYLKSSRQEEKTKPGADGKTPSWYYDYNAEQASRLRHILQSFRETGAGKRIILFTIPVYDDIKRIGEEKSIPPLRTELEKTCGQLGIEYLDLALEVPPLKDFRDWFLVCDPHWNEAGNAAAASQISKRFFMTPASK